MRSKCTKCKENEVSARFLNRDICSECYNKVMNILEKIAIRL